MNIKPRMMKVSFEGKKKKKRKKERERREARSCETTQKESHD